MTARDKVMNDRRTRDQLRASNVKLRNAIRRFVRVQEDILRVSFGPQRIDGEWWQAYRALKELMGSAPLPDCSYLGGNEDPTRCNSNKCPRHGLPSPPNSGAKGEQ